MKKLITKTTVPLALWALTVAPALAQFGSAEPDPINPVTTFGVSDLRQTLIDIANFALAIIGIVAVLMVLWGAFQYITAGSDTEKLDKGKNFIIYGIIGVVIATLSFAIISFAASLLGQ